MNNKILFILFSAVSSSVYGDIACNHGQGTVGFSLPVEDSNTPNWTVIRFAGLVVQEEEIYNIGADVDLSWGYTLNIEDTSSNETKNIEKK